MHRLYFPQILVAASGRQVMSHDIVDSEYLYNHVRCCQLRALNDLFQNVSTFFCPIFDLVTDAAHRLDILILLLVLRIQHVILVSELCRLKRSLLISSGNCLTITNVARRLITSIRCQPWSRRLLCFREWTDGHFIFCCWLSSITVFAMPSCSSR